jgi:ribosome-binding protein aMBF1 (putative translation factor)
MAKKFTELRAKMSPESRVRAETKAKEMLAEMPLNELRQARGLSQATLAKVLNVQQPSIAKLEHRTDMYLSTLRSHIEAMGGMLEIVARFPDGSVKISNFENIGDQNMANDSTKNVTA